MSGFLALKRLTERGFDLVMFPYDYDEPNADIMGRIVDDKEFNEVHMLDVSFPIEDMKRLVHWSVSDIGYPFCWIDHHPPVINELANSFEVGVPGLLSLIRGSLDASSGPNKKSAAMLAFEFYWPKTGIIPLAIQLISDYDTWKKDKSMWNAEILPFQYGLRRYGVNILNENDRSLLNRLIEDTGFVTQVTMSGMAIIDFVEKDCAYRAKQNAFEVTLTVDGITYNFVAINSNGRSSVQVESQFIPKIHDGMMVFFWNGGIRKWRFSLYHSEVPADKPLNVVARHFGGNGHAGACGFQMDILPSWMLRAMHK